MLNVENSGEGCPIKFRASERGEFSRVYFTARLRCTCARSNPENGGPFITHRRLWLIVGPRWRRPRWSSISWEIARQFCILTWVLPNGVPLFSSFIDDILLSRRFLHILRVRARELEKFLPLPARTPKSAFCTTHSSPKLITIMSAFGGARFCFLCQRFATSMCIRTYSGTLTSRSLSQVSPCNNLYLLACILISLFERTRVIDHIFPLKARVFN